MKLKEAEKKFGFVKNMVLPAVVKLSLYQLLIMAFMGSNKDFPTPLAEKNDPVHVICEFDEIFDSNRHKMNSTLLQMERDSRDKLGSRSKARPWSERKSSLRASFSNQLENRKYEFDKFNRLVGPSNLYPVSFEEALFAIKDNTSAGLPFLTKKGKARKTLVDNFYETLNREDPCVIFARTAENMKTRNVWGYPFALTLYEFMYFIPFMAYCKQQFYHASLTTVECVEERITQLVLKAIETGRVIYSVDFAGFDASVWFQFIIEAFKFITRCFGKQFYDAIMYICVRFYTIGIVTPTGVYRGKHGVPSGSTFTNLIDCIVQLGIALNCPFVTLLNCLVNGDDGLYIMFRHEIEEFEQNFLRNGLKLEKSKSHIASNYAVFCQHLYHIDYMKDDIIGGIFPVYRALCRLMYQERFVNFKKLGISGKDYYGIRAVTILEKCKHHPLHEELVRFVLAKEKYSMDISEDSIVKYCSNIYVRPSASYLENDQEPREQLSGIRNYVTMKLIEKILLEEDGIG